MARVLIGLGGNLGDVPSNLTRALARLELAGVEILTRSSLYRTTPWGPAEQPDFVNACALASTSLPPLRLLAVAKMIEHDLGRRDGPRWGARVVDVDILAYGDVALTTPELTIPHPRLTERAFVLVPLAEIAPDWIVAGRRVADWAADIDAAGVIRLDADRS